MSQRNRVARVSGMNNNAVGQLPAPGSFYSAEGAPGVTAGPATGFTVAFGIRTAPKFSTPANGTPWIDPATEAAGMGFEPGDTQPELEFLAGAINLDQSTGWALVAEAGSQPNLIAFIGDSQIQVLIGQRHGEFIGMFSFIPDGTPYGTTPGVNAALALNGLLGGFGNEIDTFAYQPSGSPFSIGGTTDPSYLEDPEEQGGAVYTEITSLWVTDGIPTFDQCNAFFDASLDSGIVIPQAWAPARTVEVPEPVTPSDPTGNYWTADGIDANGTLGSVWRDKLGNADLTRVSPPLPGAPSVEGDLVVSSRQPYYPFTPS